MMPAAARIGDPSDHPGGMIGGRPPLAATVFIENQPAAVLGDAHTCATPTPPGHLNQSVLSSGSANVFICGCAAARVNDLAACGAKVAAGAKTVYIGG